MFQNVLVVLFGCTNQRTELPPSSCPRFHHSGLTKLFSVLPTFGAVCQHRLLVNLPKHDVFIRQVLAVGLGLSSSPQ